ncbi:MAG: hypothetical protein EA397_19050 [Deltaproteobacteria bacterium]|nr:MAG: hypothetical protein EA397_19050 [Deltaproteobacteria bacterium]
MATGSAAAAHADDNTALTVNPAAIALKPRYGISLVGGFFDGTDVRFGGTAIDGVTTKGIAMGLGYQRSYLSMPLVVEELPGWGEVGQDPPSARRFDTFNLGFAVPLIEERLSVGLGGGLVLIGHPILGRAVTGNLTAGVAGRPAERWAVGLAGRNLLPIFFATDPGASVVLGNRYAWTENRALSLDVEVPLTARDGGQLPLIARAGAEWGDDSKVLGCGYRFVGPLNQHWLTLGAGMISDSSTDGRSTGTRGGLHYVAELPLAGLSDDKAWLPAVRHTLTITIMPALGPRTDR